MLKQTLKIMLPLMAITALLLGACSPTATATPTEAVSAIYTAAAQTVMAQASKIALTSKITATAPATKTPLVTATPTATVAQISSPTSLAQNFCDNSAFVADVTIPDNTVMTPGQVFDKTWAFQNTGTCAWTAGYTIIFSNGDLMGGNTRPINLAVAPQAQVNVTVKLTAPTAPGTYKGYWRLANGKASPFGGFVSVVIVVGGGTTTVTPTGATPTRTATVGVTSAGVTATATATSAAPAATVTPTPTPVTPPPAVDTATPTETPPTPAG